MDGSAIYSGEVTHQRFGPKPYRLRYRIFMLLLDLDALPALFARLRLLREGPFGVMSFHAADHGDRQGGDLRAYVETRLAEADLRHGGPIRLLCMPRILGYGFNPLSLYFCHAPDGALTAILYEVRNTFGQSHSYLIATPEGGADPVRQTAPKRFFVSPFMDMDLIYDFTVSAPGERVAVTVVARRGEDQVLKAAFKGQASALTDAGLATAWLRHPWLTVKVMVAIHWEAAKILARGMRLRRRPAAPVVPVTHGRNLPREV
jgi:DUF1365 family protein